MIADVHKCGPRIVPEETKMNLTTKALFAGIAITLMSAPALAQKSQNSLRLALNAPLPALSTYDFPIDEASVFSHEIYDALVKYDEHKQKLVPALAKSWKQVDDMTLEFELRDDIRFHNDDRVEASDVKATVDYITDPKSKITYQSRFTWMKQVEVLSPTKLRIHSTAPTATGLNTIAYRVLIWNGKVLDKLNDRVEYGRTSVIGTGPYKLVQLDTNKGIVVERNPAYNVMPEYKKATINRISALPIPDRQTQSAEFMVGKIDLLRNVAPDTAKALAEGSNAQITYVDTADLFYLAMDSVGRSGNKALTDVRVRRAISMAIKRDEIIKHIVPGGHVAQKLDADCFKTTIACSYTVSAPKYDPAEAKRLLAEAGYPNGFDLQYMVYTPNKPIGEAIAGELRKVGIRATIQLAEISLYRRLQGDGKLQAWSVLFSTGSNPDAGNIFSVLFGDAVMPYYKDEVIIDAMKRGEAEFDPSKRTAIYQRAFDRINEMHYHMPISSVPTVFVHSKDVKIKQGTLSADKIYLTDLEWN
jgi:peptide/nickel transport system substrate-binding protein